MSDQVGIQNVGFLMTRLISVYLDVQQQQNEAKDFLIPQLSTAEEIRCVFDDI